MKVLFNRLIVVIILSFALPTLADAQVVNIPEKSRSDFETRYPSATNVEWTNNLAKYTAKFTIDNATYKSHYYVNGSWHYTEKFMEKEELPKPVLESYEKSRIAEWEYLSSAFVENKLNEKAYRIEAKKGLEKKYVFYDENGKEVKATPGL